MELSNHDGDHATLQSTPGMRSTPPVVVLGPCPEAGAGREYRDEDLDRLEPVKNSMVAALWMFSGVCLAVAAYCLYRALTN
jgi:hypothetical protein